MHLHISVNRVPSATLEVFFRKQGISIKYLDKIKDRLSKLELLVVCTPKITPLKINKLLIPYKFFFSPEKILLIQELITLDNGTFYFIIQTTQNRYSNIFDKYTGKITYAINDVALHRNSQHLFEVIDLFKFHKINFYISKFIDSIGIIKMIYLKNKNKNTSLPKKFCRFELITKKAPANKEFAVLYI